MFGVRIFPLICLGLVLSISACIKTKNTNELRAELTQMCQALPSQPALKQVRNEEDVKPEGGVLTTKYNSALTCEEVKNLYTKQLFAEGWQLSLDDDTGMMAAEYRRYIDFTKGDYIISIECRGKPQPTQANDISVSCSWSGVSLILWH